jgi:hypothetical protein
MLTDSDPMTKNGPSASDFPQRKAPALGRTN